MPMKKVKKERRITAIKNQDVPAIVDTIFGNPGSLTAAEKQVRIADDYAARTAPVAETTQTNSSSTIEEKRRKLDGIHQKMERLEDMLENDCDKEKRENIKLELTILEKREKQIEKDLGLFHKKEINSMDGIQRVLIEIVDYTGYLEPVSQVL
jgi:protein subunit release factor A